MSPPSAPLLSSHSDLSLPFINGLIIVAFINVNNISKLVTPSVFSRFFDLTFFLTRIRDKTVVLGLYHNGKWDWSDKRNVTQHLSVFPLISQSVSPCPSDFISHLFQVVVDNAVVLCPQLPV